MDPNQGQAIGPGGRRLHIGHRRSPSEMTPFMAQQLQMTINAGQLPTVEQLAIQQQIELLQAQQQQILAQQQYLNQAQQQAQQQQQGYTFPMPQQQLAPQAPSFQFPQQPQAQLDNSSQGSHRRNQSLMPNYGQQAGGPPPAPSSGASNFGEFSLPNTNTRDAPPQRRTSGSGASTGGGGGGGGGHQRRHSLALPEARKAAELAQQARKDRSPGAGPPPTGFQFPIPGAEKSAETALSPAGSGQEMGSGTAQNASPTPANANVASNAGSISGLSNRSRLSGHGRSQSMAIGNGKSPIGGRMGGFQFPAGGENNAPSVASSNSGIERRGSNTNYPGSHGRSASRNFEGNWRSGSMSQGSSILPPTQEQGSTDAVQALQNVFNPNMGGGGGGHRSRASMGGSVSSFGSFSFPGQQPILMPGAQGLMFNPVGQTGLINANLLQQRQQLNQLQLQQAAINAQQINMGHLGGQNAMSAQQQQQQQRKTLFTPYLPQASLPALLSNGQLVSGILRVNKKNRSDAYVSTQDGLLDADIFICGSKDRNRALEGDLVAVELLDVDEVWGQKREKEEKKKRKDISDTRTGGDRPSNDKSDTQEQNSTSEGGIKRRGSLRQRPTQKKNDDVEVEGQSLLLNEEEEVSDEQKPLYAGHIVAVIERVAGQMFSGTLGLLRPSSQATKEKQEAERQASGRPSQPERGQDKPKIVWFKPTDKRVPLIAIPTEQAPRDFVENHQTYANRIFVACIKRWPITSLHPFGTLVEQLGEMGDIKIETDALLRDNNFGPDEFSEAVLKSVGLDNWSVETEAESISTRKDFRSERSFTIDPSGSKDLEDAVHIKSIDDDIVEIGVHITDVAHFIKGNSLVDREAKKRGTGVSLINRTVPMLPPKLSDDVCALNPGEERFTVSVVFKVNTKTGKVVDEEPWIGKSIIKSVGKMAYKDVDRLISEGDSSGLDAGLVDDVKLLHAITTKFRQVRFDAIDVKIPSLRLFFQLDDENVPVEDNLFNTSPSHDVIEELQIKANCYVAAMISKAFPEKAVLRRQASPLQRRLDQFAERMNAVGFNMDPKSSAGLHKSLFKVTDDDFRKGMETLLVKTMHRAKYFIAGKIPQEYYGHYALNLPVFTHFTSPIRRYADMIVHRQLDAILSVKEGQAPEFAEDVESLSKTIEQCNVKKDSAKNAQEQSVHLELCRVVDKRRIDSGGELICEAVVINVYESAFDVLIPEYGFEKRVHCDQLPLKKAEFSKKSRILELYWEKGVQSSSYIPEDEQPKGAAAVRARKEAAEKAAEKATAEQNETNRKNMEISTMTPDETDALFDDEDGELDDATSQMGGVTLSPVSNRPTHSMPASPTKPSPSSSPHRTRSDPKLSVSSATKSNKSHKELYGHMFKLREENGEYIQEVTEMTRLPVILRAELSKSPPCLTTRTLNPYAL